MKILKYVYLLLVFFASWQNVVAVEIKKKTEKLSVVVFGLGGRSQYLLIECLKLSRDIQIIAVCDDNGTGSLDFFINKLEKEKNPLIDAYKKIFVYTDFYADNEEGLRELFKKHKDVDIIFITSANYNHFRHINAIQEMSSCKKIYIEKPLFRSLEELSQFHLDDQKDIYVGLTLRYSTMAKIVVEKLQEYRQRLGALNKVKSWEHVRFCQALTSFMMSWRRYASLSGGLLLEKSIHDLDLALFFIQSLNIDPQNIIISTETAHNFYKKSQKQTIIIEILSNQELKKTLVGRERSPFQRVIDFNMDNHGAIDWVSTVDAVFQEFPGDDNFDNSDIIPDYHKLSATIQGVVGAPIDFELEVKIGGFKPTTQRGMRFEFEYGVVEIDVMKSSMVIILDNDIRCEFNLHTNNSDHADGDVYIAHTILNTFPEGQYTALFNDPIVQLSTFMGLISEYQAVNKTNKFIQIKKTKNDWVFA